MALDIIDRRLLNEVQIQFPLEREPFSILGRVLGIDEGEVLERLRALKEEGLLRSISGIFDSGKLGYASTLVAMHVDPLSIDNAAAIINAHRGVSHNYLRDNYLNIWFTLTADRSTDLDGMAATLGEKTGASVTYSFPARRLFKIMVFFDMVGDGQRSPSLIDVSIRSSPLTEKEKQLVKALQCDLPLEPDPFQAASRVAGLSVDRFLDETKSMLRSGVMRRYGARLNHRKAGFEANIMSCWTVPADKVDSVGRAMAGHRQVSHCYERSTAARWPYNIYAMIHGRSQDECKSVARLISTETGITDCLLLPSLKELLKRTVDYFSEEDSCRSVDAPGRASK